MCVCLTVAMFALGRFTRKIGCSGWINASCAKRDGSDDMESTS